MTKSKTIEIITDLISSFLLLVFLYTAISKLLDYNNFRFALQGAPLLKPYAGILAWVLPVMELLIVVLLFIRKSRRKGVYAAMGIIIVFTIYLTYMLVSRSNLPCNCGGVLNSLTWGQHIFLNLILIFLLAVAILLYRRAEKLPVKTPP